MIVPWTYTTIIISIICTLLKNAECCFIAADFHLPLTTCFEAKTHNEIIDPKKCKKEWAIYNIRLLSTSDIESKNLTNCTDLPLDWNELEPIKSELYEHWFDINYDDDSVYNDIWTTHGSCVMKKLNQDNDTIGYFKQGLSLSKTFNITRTFERFKISPGKSYKLNTFLDSLRSEFKKVGSVSCLTNLNTGEIYLHQVKFCYDTNFELIDCPDEIHELQNSCENFACIYYPSQSENHFHIIKTGAVHLTNCDVEKQNLKSNDEETELKDEMLKKDVDLIIFALEWLPTACYDFLYHQMKIDGNVRKNAICYFPPHYKTTWNIRGIWPMKNWSNLKDCEDVNLSEESLRSVKTRLCDNWHDIGTVITKNTFWKSQWQLYGSCLMDTERPFFMENYFKLGLDFQKKYNVTRAFEEYDIFPGQSYPLESYEKALTGHFKRRIHLKCVNSFLDFKQSYLNEVHFCFDIEKKLVDCNIEKLKISCYKDECILYPSLDENDTWKV